MHRTYGPKGLVCVSVSNDNLQDKPKVEAFLKEKGATFPNFLLADERADEADLKNRFGFRDGIRPHYVVFGRSGEKVWDSTSATDWLDEHGLEKLVERELAK